MTEAIKTVALTKKYGEKTAVNSLDLTVHKGELFSLLGVNGAGKTTTIKMLSCLTAPTSGDAFLLGDSIVSSPAKVKAKTNISPQETAVARNLSVYENLIFAAGIYGFDKAKSIASADKMMKDFALSDVAKSKAKTLSGGYARRLSIAMALISSPEILFLDEPTLGLDVIARRALWDVITSLKGNTTIILTTHYMEEAEALSDRIGIMAGGHLCAVGTAEELIAKSGAKNFEEAFISIVKEASV